MKKWNRAWRYIWLRFERIKATPEEIARGFAFGVFWGMFPLPGLQMAIAILTAAVFRSNKLAAAAGTWLTNPLTTLPFTALNFHIGQMVLRREWSDLPVDQLQSPSQFLELGGDVITSYLMGCLVMGAIAGLLSYFLGIPLVAAIQNRSAKRRAKRQRRKYYAHSGGSHHYPP